MIRLSPLHVVATLESHRVVHRYGSRRTKIMEVSNATMNDAVHGGSELMIHGMVQPTIFSNDQDGH
jgi:hypothetical protein